MIDARLFDDLAHRLESLLPPGARQAREDFSKNARATLQGALGGLDLVTREEFDVQSAVLARTRSKLEALEARVAALESGLDATARRRPAPRCPTRRTISAARPRRADAGPPRAAKHLPCRAVLADRPRSLFRKALDS